MGPQAMENPAAHPKRFLMQNGDVMRIFLVVPAWIIVFGLNELSSQSYSLERAERLVAEGRYAEALGEFEGLLRTDLRKDADLGAYLYRIAEIHLRNLSDHDKAIELLERLIRRYPASSRYEDAWLLLGEAWTAKRDRRRAAEVYRAYLQEFRNRRKLHEQTVFFRLAETELFLKNRREAMGWLERIIRQGDGTPYYRQALFLQAEKLWTVFKDREASYRLLRRYLSLPELSRQEAAKAWSLLNIVRWQYIGREEGLPDDCVSAIAFDGDDIWFGLWMGGVARYTRSRELIRIYTVRDGLASSYIRDIQVDPEEVWVATFEGVSRYDRRTASWQRYRQIPGVGSQRIKSVLVEPDSVWFGTLGYGIYRYDRRRNVWEDIPGVPLNIVKVRKDPQSGVIAFASLNAGVLLRSPEGTFRRLAIPAAGGAQAARTVNVKDLVFDGDSLYICTYRSGVWVYHLGSDSLRPFWNPGGYLHALGVRNGRLFLSTLGEGLRVRDLATAEEVTVGVKDGLLSPNILTIEFEGDYVWMGTLDSGVNILYAPELLGPRFP